MHAPLLSTVVLAPLSRLGYRTDVVVDLRTHLRRAARKRWAKASDEQKKAAVAHASHAYWDKLTPEERSAEMKRRAAKRKPRKVKG
jgi:hypothetical protein